jgi:hypothetical protein
MIQVYYWLGKKAARKDATVCLTKPGQRRYKEGSLTGASQA